MHHPVGGSPQRQRWTRLCAVRATALLTLLIILLWLLFTPLSGPLLAQNGVTATPTRQPPPTATTHPVIVPPLTAEARYQGLPAGFTPEGYPFLGDPDAPLTLMEFSDYLCPFCGRHFNQTLPTLLATYGLTGQVRFVFRDFPIASLHPTAPVGHQAALCVAEQGAPLFWAMHDELFRTQDQWRNLADPADFVAGLAKSSGADMAAYSACMQAGRTAALVDKRVAAASALGFNGTPSFQFVQSKDNKVYTLVGAHPVATFNQWLDLLVAGKEPPQAEDPKKPELPLWAKPEGLAPDPARPGFTLAGDPYKGNPQAKVVVVEFSNFQCPSCQQHALEVQPAIDQALVDTDQILWVFKNLPLRSLSQSMVAAAAGECAGEQGQFWPMHDSLFEAQKQWAVAKPDPALLNLAKQVGLDGDQFRACLSGRQALERVVNDLFDAQGIVSTTPTFVVLSNGQGTLMRGSQAADQFVATLQGFLKTANSGEPAKAQP